MQIPFLIAPVKVKLLSDFHHSLLRTDIGSGIAVPLKEACSFANFS